MNKPDDIPQEAWDAVGVWADWYTVEEAIARAIMAAKAEEFDGTLDAASIYLKEQYGYGMLSNPIDRGRIQEIRNRTENEE